MLCEHSYLMSDTDNSVDLRTEGARILGLLLGHRALSVDDLNLVIKIIDRSEARSRGLLKLYGAIGLLVSTILYSLYFGFDMMNAEVNAMIFLFIVAIFGVHFSWVFSQDNCRSSIERLLKCHKCGTQLFGFRVHKFAESQQCPKCGVTTTEFFGNVSDCTNLPKVLIPTPPVTKLRKFVRLVCIAYLVPGFFLLLVLCLALPSVGLLPQYTRNNDVFWQSMYNNTIYWGILLPLLVSVAFHFAFKEK